jgi:crotonobetainyl-CoA:carnitine CoA-transferase CaiB-like acyl-CoA transferase
VEKLQKFSIPCGPINDLADVFADPQLLSRDMFQEIPHPTLGTVKQLGLPIKFSRTPGGLDRHPPLLGEHNQEVLQDLGFSSAEIEELKAQEVI